MEREYLDVTEFVWTRTGFQHVRRHGGSIRVCKEVLARAPKFVRQSGRTGTHLMIGPDARGRFWTIAIEDLGDRKARALTAWPTKARQIRRYEEI